MSRRAEQRGWYFYDWANSTFSTTVVTLLLGPYLTELAHAGADARGFIRPFGIDIDYRSYWSYLIALSVMTQVAVLPVLGAIADYSRRKKFLLGLFAYIGAGATIAMYLLEDGMWAAGGVLFLVSNLVFGASVVVYNSFLPEIAAPQERDAVSSKGWGIGYLGGGLLLALNLVLLRKAPDWGISQPLAIRINLASAGLWWALFTVIPLLTLRNRIPVARPPAGQHIVMAGFRQILSTLKSLPRYPQILVFLLAYLVYNDAIQAVITLASQFGSEELKMPMSQLAMAILMIQFVAFAGSILFNYVARAVGAKRAVMSTLVVWAGIVYAMYALVHGGTGFFILGAVAAVVLGGSQALSRSLFSQMIPKGQEAEFFSIYEVSDKGTSWLAPLIFGLSLQWTRSFRAASLSLLFFFVVGFLILARVNVRQGAREAEKRGTD